MDNLVEIFCDVDDFCRFFIPQWERFCLDNGYRFRCRQGHMYLSEIMTILILFHMSHYRDFKAFYLKFLWVYHHKDFPTLLSYTRFVSVAPSVMVSLSSYLSRSYNHATYLDEKKAMMQEWSANLDEWSG
ncbi:putative transposase (fragment) [Xenorhabdus bovienii str. Jollieti]|uniref:Putative transposase n=1 Tax=Xenorhabdus bovienii (strain SS-2004) TaxID=406818 RepID=D3V051_XENBS